MHEQTKEGTFVTQTVTLQREHHQQGFGFCLRGGVEHGVGHFVSSVDDGSIAEAQGIKAGDQILCVEGLPLTTATHKEAVSFIASRNKVSKYWTRDVWHLKYHNDVIAYIHARHWLYNKDLAELCFNTFFYYLLCT